MERDRERERERTREIERERENKRERTRGSQPKDKRTTQAYFSKAKGYADKIAACKKPLVAR